MGDATFSRMGDCAGHGIDLAHCHPAKRLKMLGEHDCPGSLSITSMRLPKHRSLSVSRAAFIEALLGESV